MSTSAIPREKGVIADIAENLGGVFRHLLPGVLIVGAAALTHPSWFQGVDFNSWPTILTIAAISIAAGNAWFSANRYALHQLVDYIAYLFRLEGPARHGLSRYADDLALYVREALVDTEVPARARQHIAFRASSVLLIYTIAELLLLAAIWSEPGSPTYGYSTALAISSVIAFLFGIWQNLLTRRIDAAILHKGRVPQSRNGRPAAA
jgi:hypothetical protein